MSNPQYSTDDGNQRVKKKQKTNIENCTNIGQLYKNVITNTNTSSTNLYMGNIKYTITTKYNPIEIFNDYFMSMINDVCGYITSTNFNVDSIVNDPSKIATQMFLSILYYNNVIIPTPLKIYKHDSNILLGECIYYTKAYEKNELAIHIANNKIIDLINSESVFDITFSSRINNEQCSIKDNLIQMADNVIITQKMYKILLSIFVACGH